MEKQILIILVVIGLMLLAVMPTASSDANGKEYNGWIPAIKLA